MVGAKLSRKCPPVKMWWTLCVCGGGGGGISRSERLCPSCLCVWCEGYADLVIIGSFWDTQGGYSWLATGSSDLSCS